MTMGTTTGSLVQACDRADGQEVQPVEPQDHRDSNRDSRAASDSLAKENAATGLAINPQTPPAACPTLAVAQSDKSETSMGDILQHNAALWGHKPRQEGASTKAGSPKPAGKVTWPDQQTVAISLDATTAALVKTLAKQLAGCYRSPAGLQLQSAAGARANAGSVSEPVAAQPQHSMQLTPAATAAGEPTAMEVDLQEPLQPAACLSPEQPEACKGIPAQPDARAQAPEAAHYDDIPQESLTKICANLPRPQPSAEPAVAAAAAAQPSAPEQPPAPLLKTQVANCAVAACQAHQLPPGFNRRVYCSKPQRVRGRDGVRRFDLYFAAMCPRHGDSADLRSYADIRLFLHKHRSCVYQWEDLAQQPNEDNKDFKQRMKEVGLHLFTARSALPGTEVLQQVLHISEAAATAIICASGMASKTRLSGIAAAEATGMQDQAVRSALSAECDGPDDADYNYASDSDEEYEEGGKEEQEAAAEPEQERGELQEVLQKEVLLMQPLPHGIEVRAKLERRTEGTYLRTLFTAHCARHAVTKRLLYPPHLMSFLDEHGPHMGCSDVLRGNLTDQAYAERLKSLGLRFFCYRLGENELVERKLQSMLGISAGIAASIARASGLASSAVAAKGSPDQTIDAKAAKETHPISVMEMIDGEQQTPDKDGAEQMDVDREREEPAQEAAVQPLPQLPAGFSLHVWREDKRGRCNDVLHVHVKGHCNRCNRSPILNGPTMIGAFLQKHGSCRPEWGPLGQRQGESEAEHKERLQAAGFRLHNRVIRSNEHVRHVLQAMLSITPADAAAIAHACGLCLSSSSGASPTQAPGAAGKRGGGNASAAMTPGRGNAAALWLPAGFSIDLYRERRGAREILRVGFRPHCLEHCVAPPLASPSALRSFLDKHKECRPEWQQLALQPNESEADHTARMKEAGLRFCSRVLKPGDSAADVLQYLLGIPAAEAAVIAHAAGCSADAAADGPSSCGSADASAEPAVHALAAIALPDLPVTEGGARNAAAQERNPVTLELPTGFTIATHLECRPNKGGERLRLIYKGECPKHNCVKKLYSCPSLRSFINKHAACRPEWQTLSARVDESELEHHQRLQRAGLRFSEKVMKPGKTIAETLQDMLGISAAEAAAFAQRTAACAAPGLGNTTGVGDPMSPEDSGAAAISLEAPAGRCGDAALQKQLLGYTTESDIDSEAAKDTDLEMVDSDQPEPDNYRADQMDLDSDNEEPAQEAAVQPLSQLPAGFSPYLWREDKRDRRNDVLHVHVKGHCNRCNRNPILNGPTMLRAFLQKHGSCRPEWGPLGQRQGESEAEHTERMRAAGFRILNRVIRGDERAQHVLQAMLSISAADAAALAHAWGLETPTQTSGDVEAGERGEWKAMAAMTPGEGNAAASRLPAGFSVILHRERMGTGEKLRVAFRPQCLKHHVAPWLASPRTLRSFFDKHADCRPEWRQLASRPNESDAEYKARMKEAGLRCCSRVLKPGDSAADVLQDLLSIPAAEAAVIAHAAGRSASAAADGPPLTGSSDAIDAPEVAATGNHGPGVRALLAHQPDGECKEGNAAVHPARPSAHLPLPIGFGTCAYIGVKPNSCSSLRTSLRAECPKHNKAVILRTWQHLRSFLDKHAMCRREWQQLRLQAQESEKEHMERMKSAGLRFYSRAIKPGDRPEDVLQEMLHLTSSEAAAIACASGLDANAVGDSRPVDHLKESCAAPASPDAPVNEGGAGTAAAQQHEPVAESQLLQLPPGFTFATYLERRPNYGADSLRLVFRGACPKHKCISSMQSSTTLRGFISRHAGCRPEWQALAARADESSLDHYQRLQQAGLCFRARLVRPGKSVVETLQDMLGISAAEAAAILGPTPACAMPRAGDTSPTSLADSGAATASPDAPAGRCSDGNAPVQDRRPVAPWLPLELPRGLTIAVHREPTPFGEGDELCVYFKGLCLKHYADEDLRTPQQLKVFLEEHAMCRQEWQKLCKQPGESCEQHDARLGAAGLEFRSRAIQPREAVWEALQQMLGVSPAEAWKIASASGLGAIAGGNARPLERSGAGAAAAAGNATAQDPAPAARRAPPPRFPDGISRVFHLQKRGTTRALAMANLRIFCSRHKTHRSPRGYTELRNFMAAHAECMPAWRGLQQREDESMEEHRERLKEAGLTFSQRKMPTALWQQPAAAFLQESLGLSRQEAADLVKTASGSRASAPDHAVAAGQPSPSGSGDDSDDENRDADEGNSDSDGEEVWAQGGHRAGVAGDGGGYGQGEYLGGDDPEQAPGAGQANGWGGGGDDDDDDDEEGDYEGGEEGLEEEDDEGEDENDDDVEIVEHGAANLAVMRHAAAAPNQAPAAGAAAAARVAAAASQAAAPIQAPAPLQDGVVVPVVDARDQGAGPSSPDMDVLQARAEMAEGEVKMLRNNMKHARKVNEKLQAIIKKQAEQIKSLEAYNRVATTKNALAVGLSVICMAAVRAIAAAAAVPASASVAHAPAPVAAAPALAAAAVAPTASAHAPAAAAPAAAGPGGTKAPAGERVGRDGPGTGPAPAQEGSTGRSPSRRPVGAAVTSAGPNSPPPSMRSASQAQSGGRGRGSRGGGSQARSAGRLAPSAAAAAATAEGGRSSEAPGSAGRFKRERAYMEGVSGPDPPRSARKAAAKPAQRFDPTPMTFQQQAAAAVQQPAEGTRAPATESTSPATRTRNRGAASAATNPAPDRAAAAAEPDQAPPAKRAKFPFRLVKEPRQVQAAERVDRRAGKRPAEGQPATAEADAARRRLLRAAESARAFAASLVHAPDRQTEGDILRFCAGRIKEEKHRISDVRRRSL